MKIHYLIDHTYCYTHTLLNPENDFNDGHEICFSPMNADVYNEKDCQKVISQQTKIFRQGQLFYWWEFLSHECEQNSTHFHKKLLNCSCCSLSSQIPNSKSKLLLSRFLNWSELVLNANLRKMMIPNLRIGRTTKK